MWRLQTESQIPQEVQRHYRRSRETMNRNLTYWKARKVNLRETIVRLMQAYKYAHRQERELEREVFHAKKEN